jgi:ABC-2 type transport system ATP-binding protein
MVERIRLRDVRKRYRRGGPWVLDGVDLSIGAGDSLMVVGANGSGKSTLLRLLGGLTEPTSGSVLRAHATTGFAPEQLPRSVRMPVDIYLRHLARIRHLDAEVARRRWSELCERFDVQPGVSVSMATLSKGNAQKITLVQALLAPVDVLILDEPDSGLDPAARGVLDALIGERLDAGSTVIWASHRVAHDARGATVHLEHGRLRAAEPSRHQVVEIVMTGSVEALDALARGHGVVSLVAGSGGRLNAVVERTAVDRFVYAALDAGWSIESVAAGAVPDDGGC